MFPNTRKMVDNDLVDASMVAGILEAANELHRPVATDIDDDNRSTDPEDYRVESSSDDDNGPPHQEGAEPDSHVLQAEEAEGEAENPTQQEPADPDDSTTLDMTPRKTLQGTVLGRPRPPKEKRDTRDN